MNKQWEWSSGEESKTVLYRVNPYVQTKDYKWYYISLGHFLEIFLRNGEIHFLLDS